MNFVEVFLLLLATCGVTFTFVHSKIVSMIGLRQQWEKINFFKELFHCSFCTGFWAGLIVGTIFLSLKWIVPFGFAAAAFSLLWDRLVILLDYIIIALDD